MLVDYEEIAIEPIGSFKNRNKRSPKQEIMFDMTKSEGLFVNETLLSTILTSMQVPIFITNNEVKVIYSNIQGQTLISWTPKLTIKNGCGDLLHCAHAIKNKCDCGQTPHCSDCDIRRTVKTCYSEEIIVKIKTWMKVVNDKQEQNLYLLITAAPLRYKYYLYVLLVIEDISDIKETEYSERIDQNDNLMDKVTGSFEQNLQVQENVALNITKKILPTINNLRKTKIDNQQKEYIGYLEITAQDLMSQFYKTLSGKYFSMTPMEVQVADLIRVGKTTKEIAVFLDTSVRAIEVHRYNIRKKIGISKKKVNLKKVLLEVGTG